MIFPEAKSADEYELSIKEFRYDEINPRPIFDASFIYSVHVNGYNKAHEIRSNRPENDNVVIDLLFRELLTGIYLDEHSSQTGYTDSFIRVFEDGTRAETHESQLSEKRMRTPISDALWLRAEKLISKAHDASENFMRCWFDGTEDDPSELCSGSEGPYGAGYLWEITLSQNKQARLSVVISETFVVSSKVQTRDQYHLGNAMFHFKFDPVFFTDEEPWVMPTWASQLINPNPHAFRRSFGECAFILRDEGGDFIRDYVLEKYIGDKLALINGLIRIHNHLNNPGMSDEAYQKTLG
jgi:hypothetical protein